MNLARYGLGPISGMLFGVSVVLSKGIFGDLGAEPTDSATSVLVKFQTHADAIGNAAFVEMLGLGLLLIFLGHVRTSLHEGGAGRAADAVMAGGVALAGASILLTGISLTGAVAGDHGHVEVARVAADFLWEGSWLFTPGLLAIGLGATVAAFMYKALPAWLGGLSLLVALGAFAPWIGILVFVVWVLASSTVDVTRAVRPTPVEMA